MISILLSWLVLAFAVWLTAKLLPSVELDGPVNALIVAAVFGLLNIFLGWLMWLLAGLFTLGLAWFWIFAFLTRWFIDAILLKLTDGMVSSFRVRTFGSALLAALLMSGFGTLGEWLLQFGGVI